MLKTKLGVCILVTSLLAGCGGGDDGNTATEPLTANNYENVAPTVAASMVGSGNIIFDAFDQTAAATGERSGTSPAQALNTGNVLDIARFSLNRLAVRQPILERPAVVTEETEPCTLGGTLTMRIDDADNDGFESVGDSFSVIANQCRVEAGLPAVNGSFGYRITDLRYNSMGDFVSGAFEMSFTQFSSEGLVLNGSAAVSISDSEFVISYKNLTTSYDGQTLKQDYTLRESAVGVTVEGKYTINGSAYTLATPVAMAFGPVYPNAGKLRITDGREARVDISMISTGFTADLYLPGDAIRDASQFYLWSTL